MNGSSTHVVSIPAWRVRFLQRVREGRPTQEAAQLARVGMDKLYQTRDADPSFASEWDAAAREGAGRGPLAW